MLKRARTQREIIDELCPILDRSATNQRARIRVLREIALYVFEDEKTSDQWVRSSLKVLGGLRPIDVAKTASGFEECKRILGRIEYGVFS